MELFDEPPGAKTHARDWTEFDNNLMVLIDNPGKWGIVERRDYIKNYQTNHLKARSGKGFAFAVRLNKEAGLLDVWGCYHPEGE